MKTRFNAILIFLFPFYSYSQSNITVKHPQGSIVSPAKMNVFYVGVDNPLFINFNCNKSFMLKSNVGRIKEFEGNYYINFTKAGKCILTLSDAHGKNESQYEFRVKSFPLPTPTISNHWRDGDVIDKNILQLSSVIFILDDFDFSLFYETISYSVFITTTSGEVKKFNNIGAKFSEEIVSAIKQLKSGDKILYYNFKCKMGKSDYEFSIKEPMEITVK